MKITIEKQQVSGQFSPNHKHNVHMSLQCFSIIITLSICVYCD